MCYGKLLVSGLLGEHSTCMWNYHAKKDDSEVVDKLTQLAEELPTRGFNV